MSCIVFVDSTLCEYSVKLLHKVWQCVINMWSSCLWVIINLRNTWYTVVRKLFDRKYFIDNKIQGKIFSWLHDFLEIFYLEHISLMIIHATAVEQLIAVKSILLIATIIQLLHTIYSLTDPVFYAVWGVVYVILSVHAH